MSLTIPEFGFIAFGLKHIALSLQFGVDLTLQIFSGSESVKKPDLEDFTVFTPILYCSIVDQHFDLVIVLKKRHYLIGWQNSLVVECLSKD